MGLYLGNTQIAGTIGSKRIVGEIIPSLIPLSDAGLHLLDGSLIQGIGIYSNFANYIASLVSTCPNLFVTEANWQTSVNTYGVCGKFVYTEADSDDLVTIRLPKITGIIEGTTDVTALGDLVQAGLPNITGNFQFRDQATDGTIFNLVQDKSVMSGALYQSNGGTARKGATVTTGTATGGDLGLDASLSNSIYGNSNTVQPQTIKTLYYIVIANTLTTDVEIDINQVVTNLNSKANDSDVVHLTGTETITGSKTFSSATLGVTADASDDSTKFATTAFVQNAINLLKAELNVRINSMLGRMDFTNLTNITSTWQRSSGKNGSVSTNPFVAPSNGYVYIKNHTASVSNNIQSPGLAYKINNNTIWERSSSGEEYNPPFSSVYCNDLFKIGNFLPVSQGDSISIDGKSSYLSSQTLTYTLHGVFIPEVS